MRGGVQARRARQAAVQAAAQATAQAAAQAVRHRPGARYQVLLGRRQAQSMSYALRAVRSHRARAHSHPLVTQSPRAEGAQRELRAVKPPYSRVLARHLAFRHILHELLEGVPLHELVEADVDIPRS